ncbi:MAG: hypothetical protein JST06_05590 [Bacteroidetes bacterium]|nr:hypothetical protein [Bacteroidota bacterium]MBS1628599.1 hypothetical protein [Bacteroidota bacterium]
MGRLLTLLCGLVFLVIVCGLNACYYDNERDLYLQPACDTTDVTWTKVVQPIISEHCAYVGCHGGGTASGGHDFTNYTGVKEAVSSGALLGAISHNGNYTPMPYQGAQLPQCLIDQIRIWIGNGAPQN